MNDCETLAGYVHATGIRVRCPESDTDVGCDISMSLSSWHVTLNNPFADLVSIIAGDD